jgi:SAM-dependent methyltransferase
MILYALTILVSAFLLFQVQPVIAKIILPWFGGSAAVWTTCLLFFQMVLLLGYLYSHAVIRYLKPRVQMLLHCALLLVSVVVLPIYPSVSWKPVAADEPTLRILGLLAATVGLPYFLLSTTGPLLQAWYSRRFHGAMPYRLYALSNAGSMFALISYPVLFEPAFNTHQQSGMWSWSYGLFVAVCAFTAFKSNQVGQADPGGTPPANTAGPVPELAGESACPTANPVLDPDLAGAGAQPLPETGAHPAPPAATVVPPTAKTYWMWLLLPAIASVLLLAITNHLSQNVAAIPFLWVLPLSIYLLTFILCFEGEGWYRRNPYLQLLAVALGSMAYAVSVDQTSNVPIKVMVPLFAMGLFTCCMVCHGELARLKPDPKYLTHFYLMIAAGGALGGLLVGLLAPHFLNALYEMPVSLVVCAALVSYVLRQDPELKWIRRWPGVLVTCVLTLALAGYVGWQIKQMVSGSRVLVRNFYGGLKVKDSGDKGSLEETRTLTHGTINHGEEYLNIARRDLPTTYYGPNTGIGIAIREKQKAGAVRIGVIGLGTGTTAAYGRLGDYVRYYEINPLVLELARKQFFYLADCKAKLDVAMGDARLSLERELKEGHPQNFDVLAVDAFSSDSIPVHLLTKEAMDLYFRHLRPDGILAVHISNRYLDLQPVLEGEVHATQKTARVVDTEDDDTQDVFGATWVLITSPATGFTGDILSSSAPLDSKKTVRLWTDDYSNLFKILK